MIIRYLKKEDFIESCKTSSSAFIWKFNVEEELREFEANPPPKNQRILGAFLDDDKTLMAQMEIIEFENNFCGSYLKSNGIGGVASRPEYRRGGAVREMFKYLFANTKEDGYVLSTLYPFSNDYYRKFGYERVTKHANLNIPYKAIAHIDRNCNVKLFEGGDAADILDIYNTYAAKHTMMFRRTDDSKFFKRPFEANEYTYIWYDENGKPGSYASYICDRSSSTICVKEIIYKNYESLYGILGFLRVFDGNYENLNFQKLPYDSPVMDMISEHKYCNTTLNNGGSVRILDMKSLLEANEYPETKGEFALRYRDDCIHGDCIFDVNYENKKAKVEVRKSGDYDIALDAPAAVILLLCGNGYSKERLEFIPGAELRNDIGDFLRAFPKRPVDLYEGF